MMQNIQGIGRGIGICLLLLSNIINLQARQYACGCATLEAKIEWGTLSQRVVRDLASQELNQPFSNGYTPLTFAVVNHRPVAVRLLIEQGADPNLKDARGKNPLETAIDVVDVPLIKQLSQSGAQLTPQIVQHVATHDPSASYVYHAVRMIQLGSCKDGCNNLDNMNAQAAQEILSTVAVFADSLTELKRVCYYGAEVSCQLCGETLAHHALEISKPELVRYAFTQGLPMTAINAGICDDILACTTPWYVQHMIDRDRAFETLVEQLDQHAIDSCFYKMTFGGHYAISINRLLPYGVDALEIAVRNNDKGSVSFLISHGAWNRRNARHLARQLDYRQIYRLLLKAH